MLACRLNLARVLGTHLRCLALGWTAKCVRAASDKYARANETQTDKQYAAGDTGNILWLTVSWM